MAAEGWWSGDSHVHFRHTTHHHGEADHLAWLERPFAEALRALDAR